MSKELDALERGILEFEKYLEDDCNNEWLKRVVAGMKKCYQRLEAIENANPSEALEDLEQLAEMADKCWVSCDVHKWKNTINKALLKSQEQEKVFNIMKDKWVNVAVLIHSKTVEEYNNNAHTPYNLTQEEFELLKRYANERM